jgi:hypothetical protein
MASAHVAGALAVLASNNHSARPGALYRQLKTSGNINYTDKYGDSFKEPLLDLRKIANANMVGTCNKKK